MKNINSEFMFLQNTFSFTHAVMSLFFFFSDFFKRIAGVFYLLNSSRHETIYYRTHPRLNIKLETTSVYKKILLLFLDRSTVVVPPLSDPSRHSSGRWTTVAAPRKNETKKFQPPTSWPPIALRRFLRRPSFSIFLSIF